MLLKKKLNTFIEYKGQCHSHIMPTGYDDERNAAIIKFIQSKYPNDSFDPEDIDWDHCWPIARFDDDISPNILNSQVINGKFKPIDILVFF